MAQMAKRADYWGQGLSCLLMHNLVYLRNEFHFSDVYRSVNYIGLPAK